MKRTVETVEHYRGIAYIDPSMSAILSSARQCRDGKDYYVSLHPKDFGLACYGERLAVLIRKQLPVIGSRVEVILATDNDYRKPELPLLSSKGRWSEQSTDKDDPNAVVRKSHYLSIRLIGNQEQDAMPLWIAAAGWKSTIKGYGRQWNAIVDTDATILWESGASCRSGWYGVIVKLGVGSQPTVDGSPFAISQPSWMNTL